MMGKAAMLLSKPNTPHKNTLPACEFLGLSRDWLDVRVPGKFECLRAGFEHAVKRDGSIECEDFEAPKRSGYRSAIKASGQVSYGSVSMLGDNPASPGWCLLSATGGAAEWLHDLASTFRVAQANRIDAALDFRCSETFFDDLLDRGRSICRQVGRRPFSMGEPEEGRTLYFNWTAKTGLAKSPNQKAAQYSGRLYEKGKQLGQDPDWRRWEVTVRPDKGVQKERVFDLAPQQILGSVNWSRALLDHMGYTDAVEPARNSPYARDEPASVDAKVARLMMSLAHMGEQYGATVRALVETVGEDEARKLLDLALFRPVVCLDDGREISGSDLLKRMAQSTYADVYRDDLSRRIHDKGAGAFVH